MFKYGSTVVVLLVCGLFVRPAAAAQIGDPAPALTVKEWIKGGPVDLRLGRGQRIYVLDFWAVWCQPCRENIAHLTALQNKFRNKGVTFVGISNEPAETVEPFVRRMGGQMDFAVAIDDNFTTNKEYMQAFGVYTIPHSFIVDENGRIAWHGNPAVEGELETAIQQVLAKAERAGYSPWRSPSSSTRTDRDFGFDRSTPSDSAWDDLDDDGSYRMTEVVPNRSDESDYRDSNDSSWAAIDDQPSYPMTSQSSERPATRRTYYVSDEQPRGRRPNIETELDSLDGDLYRTLDGWRLEISYEVDVETDRGLPPDDLELILSLSERGYRVIGRQGRPVVLRVPLDRPTDVDDDEIEFKGRLSVDLPYDSVRIPDRLQLRGDVRCRGHELDGRTDSVKFKSRRYRRFGGVTVDACDVYVNVGW